MPGNRLRLPDVLVDRLRLAATVVGCLLSLTPLGQLRPDLGPIRTGAVVACTFVLAAGYVLVYRRRRPVALDVWLVPALLIFVGTGLRDPLQIVGCAVTALLVQTMVGGTVGAVVRSVLLAAVPVVTVAIQPDSLGRHLDWYDPQVLNLPLVVLLTGVLNRGLYGAVLRLHGAVSRESLLAKMGSLLLPATDIAQVQEITARTVVALHQHTPEVDVVIAAQRGEDLVVEIVAGDPGVRPGDRLPPDFAAAGSAWSEMRLSTEQAAALGDCGPQGRGRQWLATRLAGSGVRRVLLVGAARRVRDEILAAYRTLVIQASLAEADCGAHAELLHRTLHDPLTGLANRTRLFERITETVDLSRVSGDDSDAALMIIDLDDFKQVNDAFGHGVGDGVLVSVGAVLAEAAGPDGVPARLGGDEFALLLTNLSDPQDAERTAAEILAKVRRPTQVGDTMVTTGVSIGLAVATPALTAADLVRCADIAMYSAKARGKNRVERFTATNHGDIAMLRMIENHLAYAAARDEIVVHYQPIIELDSGRCVAVEALARWRHPTLGLLPPSIFIPVAERTGQMAALGGHILGVACQDAAGWTTRGAGEPLRVSVNVSARQLADPDFVGSVAATLRTCRLEPELLTVELTESQLIDENLAVDQLGALADLGVRIAIDDFGTGYASIGVLRTMPLRQIKIDRGFVTSDPGSPDAAILDLIVATGRTMGLDTVAEGVETAWQVQRVRDLGVSHVQGFHYARPMPAGEVPAWIEAHAADPVVA